VISFVILCHNEGNYLKKVISNVELYLREGDEIIVVDDMSTDKETVDYLSSLKHKVVQHSLNGNFSEHRNYAHQFCKNPYIFMVDCDEILSNVLGNNIHDIISSNPDVELFLIPRLNIVDGLTQDDVRKWGWRVSNQDGVDEQVINFPDNQWRLYQRLPHIQWKGKLHERPDGFKTMAALPSDPQLSLIHRKTIGRQTKQNEFYNQNFTENENRGIHT